MATRKKSPIRKKPGKAKKAGNNKALNQTTRILLASLFLVIFVLLCLFILTSLRERLLPGAPTVVYEEPMITYVPSKSYDYDDIYHLIDLQLISGPHSLGWRRLPAVEGADTREIFGDFPAAPRFEELVRHIEQTQAPARLIANEQDGIVQLLWREQLRLHLVYQVPAPSEEARRGRIAIIIDDLGPSLSVLRQILDLGLEMTPSILPGTERATASAALLRDVGREYMIHIPMEPRSYPQTNPGDDALLLQHSEDDIRRWMRHYVAQVPGAVGANNHMGSRFTENSEPMRVVLDELKRHNLFFIDSVTISSSVAFAEARRMGLKTGARHIFLDHQEDVAYIRQQLRKMVRLAENHRDVIAIGHPYPETIEAFRLEKDWLEGQEVEFVPASKLVRRYHD